MSRVPLVKASLFRGNIDALTVLGPMQAEAERRLASIIDGTRQASRADWLPMAWDYELTRVVNDIGGRDAVIALNKRSILAASDGPFLRPVVQGAFRLFGVTPRAILKILSSAWDSGTKDAGVMAVVATDTGAVITHSGIAADPVWCDGVVGIIEGIYEITGFDGTTTVALEPPSAARYTCMWSKKPS
jgi:hypothetical protein